MQQADRREESPGKPLTGWALDRLSSRRSIARLLVGVVAAWLAWETVSGTASDPGALVALAEQKLATEEETVDSGAVMQMAERALRASPLQEGALRVMALAAEAGGDPDRARSLMQLAGSHAPRDVEAQIWLAQQSLQEQDYPAAAAHVDAVLRVSLDARRELLPLLGAFANDADAQTALVDVLRQAPPWRGWFLINLPGTSPTPSTLGPFYAALRASARPLDVKEIGPFLQRLVALGDYEQAYALQADFLPAERMAALGLLNNGDFELPVTGLPFDWTFARIKGARADVVAGAGSGHALRVEFYGTRVPFRHVSQLLLLRPGRYRLEGRVKATNLRNERGMQWVISCAKKPERLAETSRVSGNRPWTTFETTFEVPDREDCKAQDMRLVLAARLAGEQLVSGEVRYDGLTIERLGEAVSANPPQGADGNALKAPQ